MKKKMFRLTLNRKLILEDICTDVRLKKEFEEGYAMLTAEALPDPVKREAEVKHQHELVALLKRHYDVLRTVMLHDRLTKRFSRKEDHGWTNEWDIPLDVFNEAIDYAVSLLKYYEECTVNRYPKQFRLLQVLRDFRNQEENTEKVS